MSSGADLFVVCKSCDAEVSAFITECPYCGHRLRKRAPKLDRPGAAPAKPRRSERRLRRGKPRLGRLRPGEMPGIRFDLRPYATIALVAVSVAVSLLVRARPLAVDPVVLDGAPGAPWWVPLTAPLAYAGTGYLVCAVLAIALFGWLLERRHGRWAPILIFVLGGAGGMLVAGAVAPDALAWGGNGAALAMLAAWAVPDLRERRRGGETDSDLMGAGVIAIVLLLLPLAAPEANLVAGAAGGLLGLVLGGALAAFSRSG